MKEGSRSADTDVFVYNLKKAMNNTILTTEDFILYLLKKVESGKLDKIRLNKLAFFVEFGYLFRTQKPLSAANYAGIDNGPVIDGYAQVLEKMEKSKKIFMDGYKIRPLADPKTNIAEGVKSIIDPLISKYSQLTTKELISLSHATDSYKITTNNEKNMGKRIDKELAALETFFVESETEDGELLDLPKIDRSKLIPYETR